MTDIDITPGQIWAWSPSIDADESQFRILTVDANRVRYEYLRESDPHIEGGFTHTPATIREQCRLVSDVDATPAPLDPSKVKVGDTVTLEGDKTTVRGPVVGVDKDTDAAVILQISNLRFLISGDSSWTLTDHQPAPNPVWMPGDTGMAMVSGKANVRVMRVLPDDRDPVARPWVSDHPIGGWLAHTDSEVTDFVPDEPRPLPTRDDLARVMHDDYLPNGEPRLGRTHREILADAVLAHLRGESR